MKQAQLDWKESIPFTLKSGKMMEVNILALLLYCFLTLIIESIKFLCQRIKMFYSLFLIKHLKCLVEFQKRL